MRSIHEAREDSRARAVGFIMAMYQRRMASSTYSLRQSLLRRQKNLKLLLERKRHTKPRLLTT